MNIGKEYDLVNICIHNLGMLISANFNKLIQYLHVSVQKFILCSEG